MGLQQLQRGNHAVRINALRNVQAVAKSGMRLHLIDLGGQLAPEMVRTDTLADKVSDRLPRPLDRADVFFIITQERECGR